MAAGRCWGWDKERETRTRWMGSVFMGKPGGAEADMGTLKVRAMRRRVLFIHLSLSGGRVRLASYEGFSWGDIMDGETESLGTRM